ncbi:unnamed protein product [Linum trigynum]|uniref:Uncharacterized protein n=1 Tax=Linum trigynum TaxID=586398 RepID=A0AAV2G844_9ROSI
MSDVAETDHKNKTALEFIEEVTSNADDVQNEVLAEILARNSGVEYLRRYGLNRSNNVDKASFKKLIPVVTYEDVKPDIDRIASGDTSPILCSQPISEFLTSSGMSAGERKLMPTIDEELDRKSHLYSLIMPVINQFLPNLQNGKGMYFLFVKSESKTPSGLPARPVLTGYYKSRYFARANDPYTNYTSPTETILCNDTHQSMYSQLLYGLVLRHKVLRIGAVFASGFIRAIKFFENNWPSLCKDIRNGTIDPRIVTDPVVRKAVSRVLVGSNPGLADFLERECRRDDTLSSSSWRGIIPRVWIWSNCKYIDVIVTGAMSQYIPAIDHYGGGSLPLVCSMYASSECYFGLNLNPLCNPDEVLYTLVPTMAYFEFLSVDRFVEKTDHDDDGDCDDDNYGEIKLVDLVDVKLGQEYELVVTTYAGLYRYRVGDVLRVGGFKNKAPQFTFVCRKNVVLSIDSDKTDEVELQTAVTRAAVQHLAPFGASLVEYTSYAETSNGRVWDSSIGPLEIRVVESGTFDVIMDHAVTELGASINQYKTPRCVKRGPIFALLNSRVVSSHFSPRLPKWAP